MSETATEEARGFALAQRKAWAKMLRGAEAPPEVATPLEVRAAHLHRDRRAGGR